jgi:hypothetical protein
MAKRRLAPGFLRMLAISFVNIGAFVENAA